MRVVAGLAVILALSGIRAAAQYSPKPASTIPDSAGITCLEEIQPGDGKQAKGSTVTTCTTTPDQGCPVDMRVRQRMSGGTVAVDANGIERKVFAQRLRLILNSFQQDNSGRKVVSAMITVHGTGTKARVQPLGAGKNGDWDLNSGSMARTLHVDLANWSEPGVAGDFLLSGFTSASRVDLESVTYDDGSTWKLSKNETCRVAPDPIMLIHQ